MEIINQNTIFKYTQVYDYLKSIKFDEYISDKRDIIHKQLYENSINKLIDEVNNENTTCKIAKSIRATIDLYNYYMISNIGTDKLIEYTTKSITNPDIQSKYKILEFNKDNFKFIEYKNKVWYYPSNINIIYTKSFVVDEQGNLMRLKIGPLYLGELWNNNYIINKDINKIILNNNYIIEYIDYVNGYVILYDKINMTYLNVDLEYIKNINKYEFVHTYDEMFSTKRNNK